MASLFPTSHLDLLQAPLTASLSTHGPDGLPQVTALSYLFEDGTLKVSLNGERQKFKNMSRNPAATLFIIDPANALRTIEVRSRITATLDTDYSFADRLMNHYGSTRNLREADGPGAKRYEVVLEPVKVNVMG